VRKGGGRKIRSARLTGVTRGKGGEKKTSLLTKNKAPTKAKRKERETRRATDGSIDAWRGGGKGKSQIFHLEVLARLKKKRGGQPVH